jgi:hypothetical protein
MEEEMRKSALSKLCSPVLLVSVAAFWVGDALAQQQGETVFSNPPSLSIEQPTIQPKDQLYSENHTADVVAIDQVWSAYVYYNDASDGNGVASLFTPNGVDQHLWNNYGTLVPSFGVGAVPSVDRFGVNEGTNGAGCVLHGRSQIATYFVRIHNPDYPTITFPTLPLAGHSHHVTTSKMVKVDDTGQTATLNATWITASTDDTTGVVTIGGTGSYRAFFVKTPQGWEINELYAINDHPTVTDDCDVNGPLPR